MRFDPYYLPEKFVTMEVLAKGHFLLVKSLNTDKYLMRHPNDAKIFEGDISDRNAISDNSDINNGWKKAFECISKNDHVHYDDSQQNCYATKDNQTDKPSLTLDITIMILLHKRCVYICRAWKNMYTFPP